MNTIVYRTGNIFKLLGMRKPIIIPHVCNDLGIMGAGFAKSVAIRWPHVYDRYKSLGSFVLGTTQFVEAEDGVVVANMIAQKGLMHKNRSDIPLRYSALMSCMEQVSFYVEELEKKLYRESYTKQPNILCPKFGAGLSGGDWNLIQALIQEIWANKNVSVVTLDPTQEENESNTNSPTCTALTVPQVHT